MVIQINHLHSKLENACFDALQPPSSKCHAQWHLDSGRDSSPKDYCCPHRKFSRQGSVSASTWVQSAAIQQVKTQETQTAEDEDGWSAWNKRQQKQQDWVDRRCKVMLKSCPAAGPKSDSLNSVSSVRGREQWAGTFGIPAFQSMKRPKPTVLLYSLSCCRNQLQAALGREEKEWYLTKMNFYFHCYEKGGRRFWLLPFCL